ncbi:hypothetical protein [uncultured Caulobacter sp.]|uniref:hypothetical protein n=1 Tax=uncultured Caulobacter sp. TaxID=158749 RepID=UPI0026038367|nr:hypothetical protein [uncultured Caulobacter sp.]
MSFGKRETPPVAASRYRALESRGAQRSRGRIGYVWAFLAITVSGFAGPAIMACMPALNPAGASQAQVALVTLTSVLPSLLAVCALVLSLIDLGLKVLGRRRAWLYGVLAGPGVFLVFNGVMSIGSPSDPLWLLRLTVAPAMIGGFVLGSFRTASQPS